MSIPNWLKELSMHKHPDITLMLVLPHHPAERPVEKPPGYDGMFYPEGLEKTPRPLQL